MERDKWLQGMREKLEAVYDHLSPAYLEAHEGYANEAQLACLEKFLERMGPGEVDDDLFDLAAYHFCPTKAQVRGWLEGAGLAIEEEEFGNGYEHVLGKKASGEF